MSTSTVRPSAVGTVTAFRAGDFILLPNAASGLRVITKENFNTELAALSRTTPADGLATLNSSGKHDIAQVNYTSLDFQGTSTVAALPDPSTLTSGQFYIVTDTGTLWSKTWTQAGEMAISDGTNYFVGPVGIATVAQGGTGSGTAAGARTKLDVMQVADVNDRTNARQPANAVDLSAGGVLAGSGLATIIGTSDFSVAFRLSDLVLNGAGQYILQLDSTPGDSIRINSANKIVVKLNSTDYVIDFALSDHDETKHYAVVCDRDGNANLYIAGAAQSGAVDISAQSTYSVTGANFEISDTGATNLDATLHEVVVFNRALSVSEIGRHEATGQIPVADQWGGAGNIYSGDSTNFASSLGNWTEAGVTAITVAQSAGTAVVTNTAATTGSRGLRNQTDTFAQHQRYRLTFDCQVTSGTGQECRVRADNAGAFKELANLVNGADSAGFFEFTPTGSNQTFSVELIGQHTAADAIFFDLSTNTGAGEVYAFDNVVLEPIGCVAAYLPEGIDSSGNVRDASSNGLHATGTNTDPLRKTQVVVVDAASPAADSMLVDARVAGSSKAGIDAEGTIRQENLATDAPVAKYAADAITTAGTVSHQIPVDIGGTTYYLVAHTHGS